MQSARVVEREDVRVRKLGDDLDLAREGDRRPSRRELGPQDLEGDRASWQAGQ